MKTMKLFGALLLFLALANFANAQGYSGGGNGNGGTPPFTDLIVKGEVLQGTVLMNNAFDIRVKTPKGEIFAINGHGFYNAGKVTVGDTVTIRITDTANEDEWDGPPCYTCTVATPYPNAAGLIQP